jgi:hypothetical protein
MRRFGRSFAAAFACISLALSGCGGGGGSGSTTPTPTPTPTPTATLQTLTNQPPVGVLLALLLTDGSVMVQASPSGLPGGPSAADFYRLTPDAAGNYAAGTWSRLASPPAGYAPYASAEAVLADGRVLFVGGEYNQDDYRLPFGPAGLSNMSAVYDPVADRWTMIPPPPGTPYIGDVPSTILPNGRFIFGSKLDRSLWSLDPATLSWTAIAATGKNDAFAEEGFTQLPGGSVLTVDLTTTPQSEHYVPALNAWIQDGPTPVGLTSPSGAPGGLTYGPAPVQTVGGVTYGPGPTGTYFPPGEIGPAILRPDGSVFVTGASVGGHAAHTAIYRPGATPNVAGSWTIGPDFPGADDGDDTSAALLPSGNVLVSGASGALYEYDGTNFRTTIAAPANSNGGVPIFLLPLPSGQVLVLTPSLNVLARLYNPLGSPLGNWAPTIISAPTAVTRGQTYQLTGTQLNGLSEAASVGDELSSATNYPLVRITNSATGHVVYARTHGHSSMGVATGALPVTTNFDVPAGTETGASTLVVVANGIPSTAVTITVG